MTHRSRRSARASSPVARSHAYTDAGSGRRRPPPSYRRGEPRVGARRRRSPASGVVRPRRACSASSTWTDCVQERRSRRRACRPGSRAKKPPVPFDDGDLLAGRRVVGAGVARRVRGDVQPGAVRAERNVGKRLHIPFGLDRAGPAASGSRMSQTTTAKSVGHIGRAELDERSGEPAARRGCRRGSCGGPPRERRRAGRPPAPASGRRRAPPDWSANGLRSPAATPPSVAEHGELSPSGLKATSLRRSRQSVRVGRSHHDAEGVGVAEHELPVLDAGEQLPVGARHRSVPAGRPGTLAIGRTG